MKKRGNDRMQDKCPYCNGDLIGSMRVEYSDIPLYKQGYDISEGRVVSDEIYSIRCTDCKKDIPVNYYTAHPLRCKDCLYGIKKTVDKCLDCVEYGGETDHYEDESMLR